MASNGKMDFKLITDIMSRRVQLAKTLEEGNNVQRRVRVRVASNTQNTHLNFILLRLTDLSNTIHNCVEKCLVCDEFIQKLREHIIQTHGVTRSSQSNSTSTNTTTADIFTFLAPIPKTEIGEDSYLPENGIPSDDLDDKDSTNSILDPPVNHFSLIVQNLKEEEEDNVYDDDEDPLLDFQENLTPAESHHDGSQSMGLPTDTDQNRIHFPHSISLKIQYKSMHPLKVFKCDMCALTFNSSAKLIEHQHQVRHKRVKIYKCDSCNKSYDFKTSLVRHKLLHTRANCHKCEFCGKYFTSEKYLASHKAIHTQEKQFKCDVCRKSFRSLTYFNGHKRMHTGRVPNTCEHCGRSFAVLYNLNRHKLLVHTVGAYNCDLCGNNFKLSEDLTRHRLIMHTGEKSFKCETCGKCHWRESQLNRHAAGKSLGKTNNAFRVTPAPRALPNHPKLVIQENFIVDVLDDDNL